MEQAFSTKFASFNFATLLKETLPFHGTFPRFSEIVVCRALVKGCSHLPKKSLMENFFFVQC